MTLNPQQRPVPAELVADGFVLRRQHPDHNGADLEAVMDSVALLRAWSDSAWPEDDFTLERNAADLAGHIEDFEADLAYGFSIFDPAEARLLGSLYIDEVAPFAESYRIGAEAAAELAAFDARIEYWLRRGTSEAFERRFVAEVERWLRDAWWFDRFAFGSRRTMPERRAFYLDLGLVEAVRIESNDGARAFHFHARPPG